MKSLMLLWQRLANESASWCHTSARRDFETVAARVEDEGVSFLTITLPAFGSDFQKALDQGFVGHNQFTGFRFAGGLPRFLGGFLDLVFDRASGCLLGEPSVEAIHAVRQLTLAFSKIELECSEARVLAAIAKYAETEEDVKFSDSLLGPAAKSDFERMALKLWAPVFDRVEHALRDGLIAPKHGPGTTADGTVGNDKYRHTKWTERLDREFNMIEFLVPNPRYWSHLERVDVLSPGAEEPVRVITVPKTLKSPRIIAIEPVYMQYVQQGILEVLVSELQGDSSTSWLVGFDDQDPNRSMARSGSYSGSLATLDMSDASDRVSNQLVRLLLKHHPDFSAGVDACRSRSADVPGHGVIRLAKFASMGSALCFPFEAMVFATVVFLGIQSALKRPLTQKDIQSWRGQVRVYGDDIIVPTHFVEAVIVALESFGFRVNYGKSFWTGRFRESCGGDYYGGDDVTVVKVRTVLPSSLKDARGIISTVSLRNQLYNAGYWKTCQWLDETLGRLLKAYPSVHPTSPVLGRHTVLPFEEGRQCPRLHRPLVKGYMVTYRIPGGKPLEDSGALLKYFLKRGEDPFVDRRHLERSGRPLAVDIKLGWGTPY